MWKVVFYPEGQDKPIVEEFKTQLEAINRMGVARDLPRDGRLVMEAPDCREVMDCICTAD